MIVLIAITEKLVMITDQFNPHAITGRQGIFARHDAPTEIKPTIEIVGAYSTLDLCNLARQAHFASHPQCKYQQKVCHLDGAIEMPQPSVCIKCGIETSGGVVFCARCQQKHYQECNGLDPRSGEGDLVPMVKVATGGPNAIQRDGSGALMNASTG